jgi:hypothetical protein
VLLRVFTHTDESNAQLGTLLDAALALMAKVLQPLGTALTTLPVGSSYPGRTTGFAFEVHYVLGNMTPHREPAWALLAERARLLAHRCSQVAAEPSHHARSAGRHRRSRCTRSRDRRRIDGAGSRRTQT